MKKLTQLLILFSLLIASVPGIFSQGKTNDPLSRVRDLVNSDELIIINSQTLGTDPNNQNIRSRIFDMDLNQSNPDSKFVPKSVQTDSIVTGNKRMTVTGGLFGGTYKHLAACLAEQTVSIRIMIPQINSGTLTWPSANRLTLPNAVMPANRSPKTPIRLASGDFYGDSKEEFVLGYTDRIQHIN